MLWEDCSFFLYREALDEHSCSFSERYQQEALDAKKGAGRQNIPVLWVFCCASILISKNAGCVVCR